MKGQSGSLVGRAGHPFNKRNPVDGSNPFLTTNRSMYRQENILQGNSNTKGRYVLYFSSLKI